jgi:hypothetical protein
LNSENQDSVRRSRGISLASDAQTSDDDQAQGCKEMFVTSCACLTDHPIKRTNNKTMSLLYKNSKKITG